MWFDKSSLWLLLTNIFTIAVAVVEQWDLSMVLWIYWGQSVVIGFFNWRRMRSLKKFSTEGLTMNNSPVPATAEGRRQVSSFFAVHYGFFHFGYFIFLAGEANDLSGFDGLAILVCIVVFFFNHRFSFQHNLKTDLKRIPNIGTMMFFPYARIIPMHLVILLGEKFSDYNAGRLIFFLILKTLADLVMHAVEHHAGKKAGRQEG